MSDPKSLPTGLAPSAVEYPLGPVTDVAVAEFLGVSVGYLRRDRTKDRVIPFFRFGGNIRYDLSRVCAALAALEEGGAHLKPRTRNRASRATA